MTHAKLIALLREARTSWIGHNLDCSSVCDSCALAARIDAALQEPSEIDILKANHQRELTRLRDLLAKAGESASRARVDNKIMRERNFHDEAVALLTEQEWITDGRECLVYCIYCRQPEIKGHDEYCRAFGRRYGLVTHCREETAEQAMRFEAMMREIDEAVKS